MTGPRVALPSDAELLDKLERIWAAGAEESGEGEDGRAFFRRLAVLGHIRAEGEEYPGAREMLAAIPEPGRGSGGGNGAGGGPAARPRLTVAR